MKTDAELQVDLEKQKIKSGTDIEKDQIKQYNLSVEKEKDRNNKRQLESIKQKKKDEIPLCCNEIIDVPVSDNENKLLDYINKILLLCNECIDERNKDV